MVVVETGNKFVWWWLLDVEEPSGFLVGFVELKFGQLEIGNRHTLERRIGFSLLPKIYVYKIFSVRQGNSELTIKQCGNLVRRQMVRESSEIRIDANLQHGGNYHRNFVFDCVQRIDCFPVLCF